MLSADAAARSPPPFFALGKVKLRSSYFLYLYEQPFVLPPHTPHTTAVSFRLAGGHLPIVPIRASEQYRRYNGHWHYFVTVPPFVLL